MISSREAAVGAQQHLHPRPGGADAADDAGDLLDRAGAGFNIGAPQLRRQQVVAAEDVKRQVAVAVVVAVEEPTLLAPVDRIVGGVEVEGDPRRRLLVRLQEQIDEQISDRRAVVADAVVPVRAPRALLRRVLERLSVLLPASGAKPGRFASSRPSTAPSTGSRRRSSWPIRSS
jgi:hypothetical protein